MERKYDVMFIVRPDMPDEEVAKLVEVLEANSTQAGAKLLTKEIMGRRRLAYEVKGFADGNYVLFIVNADGKAIHEVQRRLRVNEPVIKFIIVRVDDSEKRAGKLAKLRAGKVKRSAVEAAQAAADAHAASAAASAAAASAAAEASAAAAATAEVPAPADA